MTGTLAFVLLVVVDLVGFVLLNVAAFRGLAWIEKRWFGIDPQGERSWSLLAGQVAFCFTFAALVISTFFFQDAQAAMGVGGAERAPVHMLLNRQHATYFLLAALLLQLMMPLVMLASIALGIIGLAGGVKAKSRRAIWYATAAILLNGLLIFTCCGVIGLSMFGGSSPQKPADMLDDGEADTAPSPPARSR